MREPSEGRSGHILELDGDPLGLFGKRPDRGHVVGRRDDRLVGNLRPRPVLGLAQDDRAIAHPLSGLEEHPAELAAADHAEGRREDGGCPSGWDAGS